jgi:arylsulfatase A-like enzyme
MAAEGMRFTDAYSGCTVCAPARSVLMTGYHMGRTSVRGNTGGISLRDEDVTIAEVLRQAGYACGGFGKWGLGDVRTPGVPEKQGFDTFFGYYHQIHAHYYYPNYLWRNSRKVPLPGNVEGKQHRYSHYIIFDETLKFIRENRDRPFFCYAPWTLPHGRYEIPENDPAWQMYKDKPWPQKAKVVAAMATMIDRQVGELLTLIKKLRLDERTIVFFCSDNGAADRFDGTLDSCGPLRGFKRSMYEGGIRVPMIASWPGKIKAGAVSDHIWYFADVMPTLAELAGVDPPKGIDGISVVPTLLGDGKASGNQKQHEYLYWEFQRYNWQKRQDVPDGLMQAVRMGTWKAVRQRPSVPIELYDLSRDMSEERNVALRHPDLVAKAEEYMKVARVPPRPQIEPEKPDGRAYR